MKRFGAIAGIAVALAVTAAAPAQAATSGADHCAFFKGWNLGILAIGCE